MTELGDTEPNGDCGVIGETALAWPVQILAPLNGAMQSTANVHVVVEVAQSRPTYPAMGVSAARTQLVCRSQTDSAKFIMQPVLPREETGEPRHMISRHGIVVTSEDEPFTLRRRQPAQTLEHRSDECLLSFDFAIAPVARRYVHANERNAPRPCVEHYCRSTARKRNGHVGKVTHNSESARDEDATLSGVVHMTHIEPARAQAIDQQGSARTTRLGEHDYVVPTRTQPSHYLVRAMRGSCADIEGKDPKCRRCDRRHSFRALSPSTHTCAIDLIEGHQGTRGGLVNPGAPPVLVQPFAEWFGVPLGSRSS